MCVVVISGGIGSGKTTVCRVLNETYGWPVYEADHKVKELYLSHPTLLTDIEKRLGLSCRDEIGTFIPQILAAKIFTDVESLAAVESMVFPVLAADFQKWKQEHPDTEFYVLESATILEKPELVSLGDFVVVVDAPMDVRTARAALRNGVSIDEIINRAKMQKLMNSISSGDIPEVVDYVIDNSGSPSDLVFKIAELVEFLRRTKML